MSKLDIIVLECANKVLDGKEEKLGDYIDPTVEQLKEMFAGIVTDAYLKSANINNMLTLINKEIDEL
jgi:hypothetical protein